MKFFDTKFSIELWFALGIVAASFYGAKSGIKDIAYSPTFMVTPQKKIPNIMA
jgi:hypothetical protein